MSQKSWESSQKSWEGRLSAIVASVDLTEEAALGLRALAWPLHEGARVKQRIACAARVKQRIACAARRAGLSYWRAYDLWYRKARQILAREIEAIRAAVRQYARQLESSDALVGLACDLEEMARRVSALDSKAAGREAERMRVIAERARHLAAGDRPL